MSDEPEQSRNSLVDAIKAAHRVLTSAGVAHALLGGMAANLYRREARATQDVDFAVKASAAQTIALIDAFREAGWEPQAGSTGSESLRLVHADMPRIDVLIAGTPFEESAIGRAAVLTLDGDEILIVTPEDLIVYKLIAGRAHDYEAVAAIINAIADLDTAYIEGWLRQFGFEDRWSKAKEEAARFGD
jgi:predicted nucleotidyltransferase